MDMVRKDKDNLWLFILISLDSYKSTLLADSLIETKIDSDTILKGSALVPSQTIDASHVISNDIFILT